MSSYILNNRAYAWEMKYVNCEPERLGLYVGCYRASETTASGVLDLCLS